MEQKATINPLHRLAKEKEEARARANDQPETITARHSLDSTDLCPTCKGPTRILTIGPRHKNIKAHVCLRDRIALPLKD